MSVDVASSGTGLEVSGLTVVTATRGTPIVEDIGLQIRPGNVLGVVGESGSGKTTVGVALLGLARRGLRLAAGQVLVDGRDILTLKEHELRAVRGSLISYVPQDPASGLNPGLTVGRQLSEMLELHPQTLPDGQAPRERIDEVLDEVGLPTSDGLLRRYPHQLSGGQQQRIAIAMAFVCRPRLIVLDEPTTGLDVTTQRRILDTVRDLTRRHQVMSVYVSHDLAVVAQLADRTAVMYAGRVIEEGPTQQVFRSPRHHYTVGLIEAAPSARASTVLTGIEGRPPRPGARPPGCSFAPRCGATQDDCRSAVPALADATVDHRARCLHPLPPASDALLRQAVPAVPPRPGQALSIRDLVAHHGSRQVLNQVSLTVQPGRCTAVVGESGSGKTTLARCIVGLHTTWSGDISFGDVTLSRHARRRDDDLRRRIQYVFQNPYGSLNPRMTVGENVEEPLRHFTRLSRPERRARVRQVLDDVALGADYADRMPDQLSGGERQRVAIGRALTIEPQLLVCDEITSALDVSVQALVVEQLRKLQSERGLSLLFITHNLAVVRSIAQDVVVLERGSVVEQGPVEQVLDRPQHPYTRQLLTDLPHMENATEPDRHLTTG